MWVVKECQAHFTLGLPLRAVEAVALRPAKQRELWEQVRLVVQEGIQHAFNVWATVTFQNEEAKRHFPREAIQPVPVTGGLPN